MKCLHGIAILPRDRKVEGGSLAGENEELPIPDSYTDEGAILKVLMEISVRDVKPISSRLKADFPLIARADASEVESLDEIHCHGSQDEINARDEKKDAGELNSSGNRLRHQENHEPVGERRNEFVQESRFGR
ncbi:MAG TPA: hypothetical protein VHX44_07915 [Planctomycetota bacterium]|nr:hypothetical protein [Planctomycetota bacterium]